MGSYSNADGTQEQENALMLQWECLKSRRFHSANWTYIMEYTRGTCRRMAVTRPCQDLVRNDPHSSCWPLRAGHNTSTPAKVAAIIDTTTPNDTTANPSNTSSIDILVTPRLHAIDSPAASRQRARPNPASEPLTQSPPSRSPPPRQCIHEAHAGRCWRSPRW